MNWPIRPPRCRSRCRTRCLLRAFLSTPPCFQVFRVVLSLFLKWFGEYEFPRRVDSFVLLIFCRVILRTFASSFPRLAVLLVRFVVAEEVVVVVAVAALVVVVVVATGPVVVLATASVAAVSLATVLVGAISPVAASAIPLVGAGTLAVAGFFAVALVLVGAGFCCSSS